MNVYVDGILQYPNDYTLGFNEVVFKNAPPYASAISFVSITGHTANYIGNGSINRFPVTIDEEQIGLVTLGLFYDAHKYRDNPVVADALEKLTVAIELVKQG